MAEVQVLFCTLKKLSIFYNNGLSLHAFSGYFVTLFLHLYMHTSILSIERQKYFL